jgi:hypothetical protein
MKQRNTTEIFMHNPRHLRITGALFLMGGSIIAAVQWLNIPNILAGNHQAIQSESAPSLSAQEKQWGIQLQGVRLSAAGNLLDFRYRILDVDKAQALVDHKSHPYLLSQTNGSRMSVPTSPTVGSLRQTGQKPLLNRTYFVLFANAGRQIKAGDKVTVAVGDFKAENLIVE